jgi:hypothetical protein
VGIYGEKPCLSCSTGDPTVVAVFSPVRIFKVHQGLREKHEKVNKHTIFSFPTDDAAKGGLIAQRALAAVCARDSPIKNRMKHEASLSITDTIARGIIVAKALAPCEW